MTLVLHDSLGRHYNVVRARLWPSRRPFILRRAIQTPQWTPPRVVEVFTTRDEQIAALLGEVTRRNAWTVRAVIERAAEVFDVPASDICSHRRLGNLVIARQIAMAVASHVLRGTQRGSASAIGRAFRKDHTTVLHAVGKYREAVERIARGNGR